MKNLTLQIDKATFQRILRGEQVEERRAIYPYNANRYVRFYNGETEHKYFVDCFDGDVNKMADWVWGIGEEERTEEQTKELENVVVEMIPYTQLTIINGRRKDAPRMIIEVVGMVMEDIENENGEVFTVEWEGREHPAWRMCYKLGKVLSTQNV